MTTAPTIETRTSFQYSHSVDMAWPIGEGPIIEGDRIPRPSGGRRSEVEYREACLTWLVITYSWAVGEKKWRTSWSCRAAFSQRLKSGAWGKPVLRDIRPNQIPDLVDEHRPTWEPIVGRDDRAIVGIGEGAEEMTRTLGGIDPDYLLAMVRVEDPDLVGRVEGMLNARVMLVPVEEIP